MGDSDGVFGGNGSVVWSVDAARSRRASVKIRRRGNNVPVEDGDQHDRWEATGVTEVAVDPLPPATGTRFTAGSKPGKPHFTITIELPRAGSTERQDALDALAAASKAGDDVGWVRFFLPIVGNHERQIHVEWPD
jgi:hypothetical protein